MLKTAGWSPARHCAKASRQSSAAAAAPRPRGSSRCRWRPGWRQAAAPPPVRCSAADAGADLPPLPRPKKPAKLEPSYWISREEAVEAQLKALKHNNFPTLDHGIETLYRFAGFDPFRRSDYFGVNLDLGQFERFRRIMYTPFYSTLVGLSGWEVTSSLEVGEGVWACRVHVVNDYRREARDYTFHMQQRCGGKYDGVWYTSKLQADGCTAKTLYGVI